MTFRFGSILIIYCGTLYVVLKLIYLVIVIIITQEISIVHNPQLKAKVQCADRKMQNKYLYKNKNKKEEQTEHTMTTTPWTIIQSTRSEKEEEEKEKEKNKGQKGGKPLDY